MRINTLGGGHWTGEWTTVHPYRKTDLAGRTTAAPSQEAINYAIDTFFSLASKGWDEVALSPQASSALELLRDDGPHPAIVRLHLEESLRARLAMRQWHDTKLEVDYQPIGVLADACADMSDIGTLGLFPPKLYVSIDNWLPGKPNDENTCYVSTGGQEPKAFATVQKGIYFMRVWYVWSGETKYNWVSMVGDPPTNPPI